MQDFFGHSLCVYSTHFEHVMLSVKSHFITLKICKTNIFQNKKLSTLIHYLSLTGIIITSRPRGLCSSSFRRTQFKIQGSPVLTGFSWFSSVRTGKCWEHILTQAMKTSFLILSTALCICY